MAHFEQLEPLRFDYSAKGRIFAILEFLILT